MKRLLPNEVTMPPLEADTPMELWVTVRIKMEKTRSALLEPKRDLGIPAV